MATWVRESKPFYDPNAVRGDETQRVRVELQTTADVITAYLAYEDGPFQQVLCVNDDAARVIAQMILDVLDACQGPKRVEWRER
jgi:hypothetical protein